VVGVVPQIYSITVRRFVLLFFPLLPLALLHMLEAGWLIPLVTVLAAYPLPSIDQVGAELEDPLMAENLGPLPLLGISAAIERSLLARLEARQGGAPGSRPRSIPSASR
jgi:predicted membrane chloride channel (bestrophin family)